MLHWRMGPPRTLSNVVWMHPHVLGHAGICERCSRHMTWPLTTRSTRELGHNGARSQFLDTHSQHAGCYAYVPSREACMAHVHARKPKVTRSCTCVPKRQDAQLHLSATRIAKCMGNIGVHCGVGTVGWTLSLLVFHSPVGKIETKTYFARVLYCGHFPVEELDAILCELPDLFEVVVIHNRV